jgi:CRP-like cAMP-binding protein
MGSFVERTGGPVQRHSIGRDGSERLRAIPLFEGLSAAQLRMLAEVADGVEAEAGESIMVQSTRSYQFVIIEEGEAEVLQNGARIRMLGPGNFFGELSILKGGTPRTASVIATTPLRALVLSSTFLHQIRERVPLVGERIDREAYERLARDANAAGSAES